MGKQIPDTTSFQLPNGQTVTIETGKLATQADGSVVVRCGNTMVFATVVSRKEAKEGQTFFPLSVDYQEKFASAGRIPGNFFKRETKLSDYEVLVSRLVDRVIRPLFPDGYMNETQVIINLISAEKDVLPDVLAGLAASAAITISDVPFAGPISEVRVARIEGEYVVNPKKSALEKADIDLVIGATIENVMMVEGEAKECSENELVEAIKIGHEVIKVQCQAQLDLAAKVGKTKRTIQPIPEDEEVKALVAELAQTKIYEVAKSKSNKLIRRESFTQINGEVIEALTESKGEEYVTEKRFLIDKYYSKLKKKVIRQMVLAEKIRLDGRTTTDVRPIWTEVNYLPSAHGSSIFTRGETQSLTSLTLGSKLDEQLIDNALGIYYNKFYLHYNFPAYSVGEVKPLRAPGRREIGHANLAFRSLKQVLPENTPYTIRLVSDILESNGSSSMATVCAGSMALMDGGIQIKSQVSGIAMGLIKEGEQYAILSDILGDEDALGDMDFKVTGTENGICACQMDIKIDGLPYELLEKALTQAKEGRLHILSKMNESIAAPRQELKPHAPRMITLNIDKSFIGAVIGPGGKIIQEMQRETETVINIEEVGDVGVVTISGSSKENVDKALERIRSITHVPQIGDVYDAKVASVMPYGCFVDFLGNRSGLVHISEISWSRIEQLDDVISEGDQMRVKLIGIDSRTGRFKLSRKALLERPKGGSGNNKKGGGHNKRPPRKNYRR